jgi:hypothetical protein
MQEPHDAATVALYWLPLGADDPTHCVRWNGRIFEAVVARREHRNSQQLYHSALEVIVDNRRFVIEMAPVWGMAGNRGVVAEGPVGLRVLGRSRYFRYEVRRWEGGSIPDVRHAVESPRLIVSNDIRAQRLLDLVPQFPTATWGLDEQHAGEMWNSNSLTAWLLVKSGHQTVGVAPPRGGRAPGWRAGSVIATRRADRGHAIGHRDAFRPRIGAPDRRPCRQAHGASTD